MPSPQVIACSKKLKDYGLCVAFAESATAGRMASEFSLTPESGKILKGGIVCYDACIKQDILNVPATLIKKYTPESAEVTEELAKRLPCFMKADVYAAVTGLVTPGGSETADKPVGTIFVHVLYKDQSKAIRKTFFGSPLDIVTQAIDATAKLILKIID